jgi:hypothetical protein
MVRALFHVHCLLAFWLQLALHSQAQPITSSRSEGQSGPTIPYELIPLSVNKNRGARQAADYCNLKTNPKLKSSQLCTGPGSGPIYYTLFSYADLGSNCDGPLSFEMSDGLGNFDKAITIVTGPTNSALFDSLFYHPLPANVPTGTNYKFRFRYQNTTSVSNEIGPFTINALPTPILSNDGPLSCLKSSVTLTAGGGQAGATYVFSNGSTQSANQNGASLRVTQTGPYSVTVTNPGGCSASALTNVTSNTILSNVSLTNSGPLNATNPTILLSAQGGNNYLFSGPANQPDGPASSTAIVTHPGLYSVTVTGPNGCSSTASTLVTGAQSLSTCPTDTAVLRVVTSGNPTQYEWYRNSTNSALLTDMATSQWGSKTASLTIVNQQNTGDYYVRTTETTGVSVTYGPIRVSVDPSCQGFVQQVVYLPDCFTPNGDGLNDNWSIIFPFPSLKMESLTLFNRWGKLYIIRVLDF